MSLFPCSRAYAQILGCGTNDIGPALMVVFDSKRYLFNCGEGTQRFCIEWKLRMSKITQIFLTRLHSNTTCGIHGMMMTIADTEHPTVQVRGPTGLIDLDHAIKDLVPHKDDLRVKFSEYNSTNLLPFEDDVASITPYLLNSETHSQSVLCYSLKMQDIPGKFDVSNAVKLGVPKGPLWGELKKGNAVVLPSGKTIHPSECVGESSLGPGVFVIDIPDESFLRSLLDHHDLRDPEQLKTINLVVHMISDELLSHPLYAQWINRFSPTSQHIVLNANANHRPIYRSSCALSARLSLVDSDIFPLAYTKEAQELSYSDPNIPTTRKIMRGTPLLKYNLYPVVEPRLDESQIVQPLDMKTIHATANEVGGELFRASLLEYKNSLEFTKSQTVDATNIPFELVFLGTGSAKPSTFRSVTGTYLSYGADVKMLLDCGEGSYGQLYRIYGPERADDILLNMNLIWVSHMHTDHNFGLVPILQRRVQVAKLVGRETRPLLVVGPIHLETWLKGAQQAFGQLSYTFQDCRQLLNGMTAQVKDALCGQVNEFRAFPVVHCDESYGLLIEHATGHRLVFSGDTWKCDALIEAGRNCDILIHDSTFEDGMEAEAELKLHSTIGQAVDAAQRMGARFLFLTHFSQRYPKFPVLPDLVDSSLHIGVAFDMLVATDKTLARFDTLRRCICYLFQDLAGDASGDE